MRSSTLPLTILAIPHLSLALSRTQCKTACNAYLAATELSALYYQTSYLDIQAIEPQRMNEICMVNSDNIDTCTQCTLSNRGLSPEGDRRRLAVWQATCQTWEYTSPEQALECWEGWPEDVSSCWEDGIVELPEVVEEQDIKATTKAGAAAPASSASSSAPEMTGARTTGSRKVVTVSKDKTARPSRMEDGNAQMEAHRTSDERDFTAASRPASSPTEYASLAICFSLFALLALWPPQALKVDRVFQSC